MLSEARLREELPEGGLFRGEVPWLLSPKPFELSKKQVKALKGLGHVLSCFYDSCSKIYNASSKGAEHGWLAPVLDAGKPEWLVEAQRSSAMKREVPSVIRPDLILTEEGWCMTELDSVPGGQGVTAFLSDVYSRAGWPVLGGGDGLPSGFRAAHPDGAHIAVSEESADYFDEMAYFASRLGEGYSCGRAEGLKAAGDGFGTIYRFFELFDTGQVPGARELIESAVSGATRLSPPPVPHLEEKLWLALFHMPGLQETWAKHLRGAHRDLLKRLIPHSWVLDPQPLPPQASLPWLEVNSWDEVAAFSQKERRLVLKISGFNELAWGARGVFIGHDMPSDEWKAAVHRALDGFRSSPWIMQEFHQGMIVEHSYYERETGFLKNMMGRVRLCPYYYRRADGRVELGGCLATIVPSEKKKIHGMKDGILVPCSESR